jgi:hypothetical protein
MKLIPGENFHMVATNEWQALVHSTSTVMKAYGALFRTEYYSIMKEMGDTYKLLIITSDDNIEEGDKVLFKGLVLTVSEFTHDDTVCFKESFAEKLNEYDERAFRDIAKKIIVSSNPKVSPEATLPSVDIQHIYTYFNDHGQLPTGILKENTSHGEVFIEWESHKTKGGNYKVWLADIGNEKAEKLCKEYYGTSLSETRECDIEHIYNMESSVSKTEKREALKGYTGVTRNLNIHFTHCYQGEYKTSCKYGDDTCPAKLKTERGLTDGAPITLVATELKKCADSWDPKVRLLGNIRAEDISRLCANISEQILPNVKEPIKKPSPFSKEKFITEMETLVSKLDVIDKETPWQAVEPTWWLEMMEIRQAAFNAVQKFKVK